VFAFDCGDLDVRGYHIRLHQELAPGCADADDLHGGLRAKVNQGDAWSGAVWLELSGALHDSQRASSPWP
jgi:hypothetical protein